jgi:phage terminase small subunit
MTAAKPDDALPPPPHLSERAAALWRQLVSRCVSPGRPPLLQTALEALDRADEVRAILAREGLTTKTESTGAVHVHPLAKVERENRQLFARLWEQLGLSWDGSLDGRRLTA